MSNDGHQRLWLSDIYQRYADDVFNVIRFRLRPYGLDDSSDDLLQDVFITAYEKCDELAEHPNVRRWLFATAHFKSKNFIRRKSVERRRILSDGELVWLQLSDQSAEDALARIVDGQIDYDDVLRCIKEDMSEADRQLYAQTYEEKMPSAALSETYGISEAAMRMRISRMRKKVLLSIKNLLCGLLICGITHIL